MIKAVNLEKKYKGTPVLKKVSLNVDEGDFISIMGASGSGKSTLLYALSAMDRADEGKVVFEGVDLYSMEDDQLQDFRRSKIGFVFQNSTFLKDLNILDNVLLPSMASREDALGRAEGIMKSLGIWDLRDRDTKEVSGGQLQRANIARALINSPKMIFADEPTGALNSQSAKDIMDIFIRLNDEGKTIILVTHDAKVAASTKKVLFIKDGEIINNLLLGQYSQAMEKERQSAVNEKILEFNI